jgi:hypothetical protein
LEVSANYLKAVDLFGRDRKNSVRFAVSQLAYDFDFRTRSGVLLARMTFSDCTGSSIDL